VGGGVVRNGTRPHGDPAVRFRASGTFIYEDPLENIIIGRELFRDVAAWGKAETGRLGYENSEDAVSWNVFRSLQEEHMLAPVVEALVGGRPRGEAELIMWGREILADETGAARDLQAALDELEPGYSQQTEPDIAVRRPGQGWVLIEAKFTSPMSTYGSAPGRVRDWTRRYAAQCPGVFNENALAAARPALFYEQLLRNVALAAKLAGDGQRAHVLALVRRGDRAPVEGRILPLLRKDCAVIFVRAAWEGLY
jgi:hypothetical protein